MKLSNTVVTPPSSFFGLKYTPFHSGFDAKCWKLPKIIYVNEFSNSLFFLRPSFQSFNGKATVCLQLTFFPLLHFNWFILFSGQVNHLSIEFSRHAVAGSDAWNWSRQRSCGSPGGVGQEANGPVSANSLHGSHDSQPILPSSRQSGNAELSNTNK